MVLVVMVEPVVVVVTGFLLATKSRSCKARLVVAGEMEALVDNAGVFLDDVEVVFTYADGVLNTLLTSLPLTPLTPLPPLPLLVVLLLWLLLLLAMSRSCWHTVSSLVWFTDSIARRQIASIAC